MGVQAMPGDLAGVGMEYVPDPATPSAPVGGASPQAIEPEIARTVEVDGLGSASITLDPLDDGGPDASISSSVLGDREVTLEVEGGTVEASTEPGVPTMTVNGGHRPPPDTGATLRDPFRNPVVPDEDEEDPELTHEDPALPAADDGVGPTIDEPEDVPETIEPTTRQDDVVLLQPQNGDTSDGGRPLLHGEVVPSPSDPVPGLAERFLRALPPPSVLFPTLGAVSALAYFLRFLPGFSRLEKSSVLVAPRRQQIAEAVRSRPWCSLRDLEHATGLPRSSLRHHLRVLKAHGVVAVHHDGAGPRFHDRSSGKAPVYQPAVAGLLRHELESGSQRLAKVMRRLIAEGEYSRYGAWKVVNVAAKRGLVTLERRDGSVWVQPGAALSRPSAESRQSG